MALDVSERPVTKRSLMAQNTKRRMVDAAIATFSERGYEKATTRELAQRAGVSEALIYRHFGGKRELLFAALESERDKERAPTAKLPPDAELVEHIGHMIRSGVSRMFDRRDFMRVCMSLAAVDPELGHLMESLERQGVANLKAQLEDLRLAGIIATGADLDAAASAINMMVFGLAFNWRVIFSRSQSHVNGYAMSIAQILTDGLSEQGLD